MPWQPKSSAPAHFNLADEFVALITGDDQWAWLTPWAFYLGVPFYETAAFCAQGPGPAVEPLTLLDFVTPTIGPGALADKLSRIARDRVFGAFCELPLPTGAFGDDWIYVDVFPSGTYAVVDTLMSAGSTQVEVQLLDGFFGAAANDQVNLTQIHPPGDTGDQVVFYHNIGQNAALPGIGSDWLLSTTVYPAIRVQTILDATVHVRMRFNGAGLAAHTPTVQPPVIGALPPTLRTYGSIADLGVELDHQEDKLDQIRQTLAFLVQMQASPSLAPDNVADGPEQPTGDPVPIPLGAIAAVVTVTAIPASSSVENLAPQRYSRLGMVTLGTSFGWLPSQHLEHNPQLVVPLPPWVTFVRVSVFAPATSSVRFLTKL
jgi:hypothetical protein